MSRLLVILFLISYQICLSQEIIDKEITIIPLEGIIVGNDSIMFESMTIDKLKEIFPMIGSSYGWYKYDDQVKDSIIDFGNNYTYKNLSFVFYDKEGFTRVKIHNITEIKNISIKPDIKLTGEYIDFFEIYSKQDFDSFSDNGEKSCFFISSQGLIIETPNKKYIKAIAIRKK